MGHPGLKVEIPEKPEALVLYQQCKTMGIPLVEGGLLDQPYYWMQEYAVIMDIEALYQALAQQKPAPPPT